MNGAQVLSPWPPGRPWEAVSSSELELGYEGALPFFLVDTAPAVPSPEPAAEVPRGD